MKKKLFLILLLVPIFSLLTACAHNRGDGKLVLYYTGQNNLENSVSIDSFSDYFTCGFLYDDGSFVLVGDYQLICTTDGNINNQVEFDSHVTENTQYCFVAKVDEKYSENNPILINVAGYANIILECNNDYVPTGDGVESSTVSTKKYFVYTDEETNNYCSCFDNFEELKGHLNAYYKFLDNTTKPINLVENSTLMIVAEPNQLTPNIESYSIKCVDSFIESNTLYVKNLPATYSVSVPTEIACYAGQTYEDVLSRIVIDVSTTVNKQEIESSKLYSDDCFYKVLNAPFITSANNLVDDKEYILIIKFVYKDDIFRKTIKIKQYALAYEYLITADGVTLNQQLNYTIFSMTGSNLEKSYIYGVCTDNTSKATYMYNTPCMGYSGLGENVKYSSDYSVYSKLNRSFRTAYCEILQNYLNNLKLKGINATIEYLPSLSYLQGLYYTSRIILKIESVDTTTTYSDLLFTKTSDKSIILLSDDIDSSGEVELNKAILFDYSVFLDKL